MGKKGFTLIEIMIVVTILAVLSMVAVPNFMESRQKTHKYSCISNLKSINNAKEVWALESGSLVLASPSWDDLVPVYLRNIPSCPAGGTYTIGDTDELPTCTVAGHSLN